MIRYAFLVLIIGRARIRQSFVEALISILDISARRIIYQNRKLIIFVHISIAGAEIDMMKKCQSCSNMASSHENIALLSCARP